MVEKKHLSLRQRILTDLESTAPTSLIDPELAEFDINTTAKLFNGTDKLETIEDAEEDESREHFGTFRKRAGIMLDDDTGKYSGERISRKTLNNKWNDAEEGAVNGEHGMDNDLDKDEEKTDSESDVDDDGCIDQGNDDLESEESSNYGNDYDDNGIKEDDSDADCSAVDFNMVIDPSKLPANLRGSLDIRALDDDGEGSGMENFTAAKGTNESKKADATRHQLEIWDKLLENRIRFQKCLTASNVLPHSRERDQLRCAGGAPVVDLFSSVQASLSQLLGKLLELQSVLMDQNAETQHILTGVKAKPIEDDDEEIPSDTDEEKEEEVKGEEASENALELPSKRKHTLTVDEYEEELMKRHKAFHEYQNNVIGKWYEKTRLMSGKVGRKFNSFDRSPLVQIQQVLQDRERLLKRTQLKRTPFRVLGTPESTNDTEQQDDEPHSYSNDQDAVDAHLKDHDTNVFDDSDFYHELLKELIETKSGVDTSDSLAVSRQWLQLQKLRSKAKRKVDTRASKGRKVRYAVHPKLVNFMTTQPIVGAMNDRARNDLFASTFGKTVNVMMADEDVKIF